MAYGNQNFKNKPLEVKLPDGYLKGGYFNTIESKKVLKVEYVTKFAKDIANSLKSTKKGVSATKLRAYYDRVVEVDDGVARGFYLVEEGILELQALESIAYKDKQKGNAPSLLEDFIKENNKYIKDKESIHAFRKHFEAVLNYSIER